MKVSGNTVVSGLKAMFKEEFGIGARVYNGSRLAEDSASLASFRKGGAAETGDLEIRNSMEVGAAEKQFKDAFGITVKIEDSTGKLADKSVTIASLKPEKAENDVKEAGRRTGKASSRKASSPKIKKGGYVEFGSYYQENSAEKTPIVWLVLETSGSRALLISRSGLDCREYHHEEADVTWENCDLRKWLNTEFLRNAFTPEEQEKIAVTKIAPHDNAEDGAEDGSRDENSTEDRVFCLSASEAENLFKNARARQCVPTLYADDKGANDYFLTGKGTDWWLRSPGSLPKSASVISWDGSLYHAWAEHCRAVRPVLWADQDALKPVRPAAPTNIRHGDLVKFGRYYQESGSRKTPIEWVALKKNKTEILLVSRYVLDCQPYGCERSPAFRDVTWENCDLRKWLNTEFLRNAFTAEEQEKIAVTNLHNDLYGDFGRYSAEDRVFCLSFQEASLTLKKRGRKCAPTPYAANKGAYIEEDDEDCLGNSVWWLRDYLPRYGAMYVESDGSPEEHGDVSSFFGVRPALWVSRSGVRPVRLEPKLELVNTDHVNTKDRKSVRKGSAPEIKKGDRVEFGSYYQENGSEKTPIEWITLDISAGKALLISRYGLDSMPYHHEYTDITWEHCDLRKWLNGEFFRTAFTEAEQEKIAVTELRNGGSSNYGSRGGNSTEDRVFCLSLKEARDLSKAKKGLREFRKCDPTPYAIKKGAFEDSTAEYIEFGSCCWWLRSPGDSQHMAAFAEANRLFCQEGYWVGNKSFAARPAIWVNPDNLKAIKPDEYVCFGSYYQENGREKTPIEWLPLKKSGGRTLLLSRYGLDSRPYHYEYADITWENCDLRKWLNGEFLMTAFSPEERERIAVTMLPNDDNPLNGAIGGNSTEDRVFCLSLAEARSRFKVKNPDKNSLGDDSFLFKDRESRKCIPTLYAAEKRYSNHSYDLLDGKRCCFWWLRSPGIKSCRASSVCADGELHADGCYVFDHLITVRPALWVNL